MMRASPASTRSTEGQPGRRARVLREMSIVIPTLGRPILGRCLAAIEAGTAWPAHLIVVDQSSSPKVAAWLEELASRGLSTEYVASHQIGRAAGVNRGIERVRTRYLAVTDDDCIVAPDWLESLDSWLREHPGCVVTGRVDPDGDGPAVATMTSTEPMVFTRPRMTLWRFCGCNMAAPRSVFDRVGLFDEDACLRVAEDNEWSYRLLRTGVRIVYEPAAAVTHVSWRDAADRDRQYKAYARSEGGFYGKYMRRGDLLIAGRAVYQMLRSVRNWAYGRLTRDSERAAHGRAFTRGLIPGMVAGWRSERCMSGRGGPGH